MLEDVLGVELPLAPSATLEGMSRLNRPNVTAVFVTGDGWTIGVAGIACVNEMKISGVVVGGSTKTGVSAAVGTSFVGAIFTDISHARVVITRTHMDKMIFFTIVLCMVAFPFILDHIHEE
jgi:hypothetical protein